MISRWHEIHARLRDRSHRFEFVEDFRRIVERSRALPDVRDPAALLAVLHAPNGDPASHNEALKVFVEAAQKDDRSSPTATIVLTLALWPGLDAAFKRVAQGFDVDPEELASEMSSEIALAIRKLNLDRVNRIAATLILNTERDVKRRLSEDICAVGRHDCLDDLNGRLAAPEPCNHEQQRHRLKSSLGKIVGRDAELVLAIAVDGFSALEASAAAGLGYEAGRKRYRRTLDKLRQRYTP